MRILIFIFFIIIISCTGERIECDTYEDIIYKSLLDSYKEKKHEFNIKNDVEDSMICKGSTEIFCKFLEYKKLYTDETFCLSIKESMGEAYDAHIELLMDNVSYLYDYYPHPMDTIKFVFKSKSNINSNIEDARKLSQKNLVFTPFNYGTFRQSKTSLYHFRNNKFEAYFEY